MDAETEYVKAHGHHGANRQECVDVVVVYISHWSIETISTIGSGMGMRVVTMMEAGNIMKLPPLIDRVYIETPQETYRHDHKR